MELVNMTTDCLLVVSSYICNDARVGEGSSRLVEAILLIVLCGSLTSSCVAKKRYVKGKTI